MGSTDPQSRPSQPAGRSCSHWQPHPQCKPQPPGTRESPGWAHEPPSPKESHPRGASPAPWAARSHTRNVEAARADTTSRRQSPHTPASSYLQESTQPQWALKTYQLKVRGVNSKERNYPRSRKQVTDRICRPDQEMTHPLKKRGTTRFSKGTIGSTDPHRQPPNHSRPSQRTDWPCGHRRPHQTELPGKIISVLRKITQALQLGIRWLSGAVKFDSVLLMVVTMQLC